MRTVAQLPRETLDALAAFYGMSVAFVAEGSEIPGSHWGAPEAGLKAGHLYLQASTPVHSFLHELAHVACMDSGRARTLDTDAGGTDQEEEARLLFASVSGRSFARLLATSVVSGYGRVGLQLQTGVGRCVVP